MKISLVLFLIFTCAHAQSTVLTFEDIPHGQDPTGYGGLSWQYGLTNVANNPMLIRHVDSVSGLGWEGSGYVNGYTSGELAILKGGGLITQIDALTISGFNFTGAYFTSGWVTQDLTFHGYLDGVLKYGSGVFEITTLAPLWIELNWGDIDSLIVTQTNSTQSNQWIMDDFTYTSVPIPGTAWLFGSGLGFLGWVRRCSKNSSGSE